MFFSLSMLMLRMENRWLIAFLTESTARDSQALCAVYDPSHSLLLTLALWRCRQIDCIENKHIKNPSSLQMTSAQVK